MKKPSEDTQKMLETLQKAVNDALDKKRRLGQYAVIWRNNRPVAIGENAPESLSESNP
ncbi:MAG: hypothetical protein R3F02_07210 [Thiolinea sp.]